MHYYASKEKIPTIILVHICVYSIVFSNNNKSFYTLSQV